MLERYKDFAMTFEMNEPGVLEIIFDGPNLNAVDERVHTDIPEVWKVHRSRSERPRGARARSRPGIFRRRQLRPHPEADRRLSRADARARGVARPLLQHDRVLQADHLGDPRPGGWRGTRGSADGRHLDRRQERQDRRRPYAARRRGRRSCRSGLAAALRDGQGQVPASDLRDDFWRRGRADRPRILGGGRGQAPGRLPEALPASSTRARRSPSSGPSGR